MEKTSARETSPSPLVSVIISTYNRSKLLKQAIESVLAQSFTDFELLIIDDCSTDDTEKVIDSFKDDRIISFQTKTNRGHDSMPKNLGISAARGQHIAFLDDDDTYRKDALKILYTYAKETEAGVVYGDYLIGKKPGWSLDFSPTLLGRMNFISMCVVMVRKDALLDVGGFDENVPKFKDWNLWIRLQKAGYPFIHVPILVADVRIEADSISEKYKVKYDDKGNYLPILLLADGTEKQLFDPVDCPIYSSKTILGEKKPLKVAVYTLTMNRLDYTKKMADSICRTAGYPFDWLVIDQGSTDGTLTWLQSIHKDQKKADSHIKNCMEFLLVEPNEKNVGLANGWNQAIELAKKGNYDIIVKVDNDAQMLTEGWLKAMVELFERNRTLLLSPYVEGLEGSPGGVMRQRSSGDSPYTIINQTVLGSVPNLGGIVFAHHIDLVKEWKFNATYEGNKDFLLSKYARSKGYNLFYMEEFRVWHIDGTEGQHKKYPDYFTAPSNDSVK